MDVIIKFRHADLDFGKTKALSDINLTIDGPKIYGLLGRNGSGKTTLLSLLANYREVTRGELTINGEPLFENENQVSNVHFTFQRKFEEETEKGKDILKEAARFIPSFDFDYAVSLAERFQLDLNMPMKKHSTGRASIFQVIKGMASRAPVTIFDEAYTGMDAPARELFYEIILEEQALHPRIFILSTHLISEMEHLFDEVIILHESKVLLHDNYESLLSQGASLTGNAETVDRFASRLKVLKEKRLGRTKSIIVFQQLNDELLQEAEAAGLDVGSVTLQDVFTNVTKGEEPHE
jgi:ABC-2 type transport system ATP-binding protein